MNYSSVQKGNMPNAVLVIGHAYEDDLEEFLEAGRCSPWRNAEAGLFFENLGYGVQVIRPVSLRSP